jgi:hypothetical protein
VTGDALSYDIFSQAAQAVRHGRALGGLRMRQVLATGHSQSAFRLRIYHNSIHPLAGVIDGFVLRGLFGDGTVRSGLGTPVFKLNSESDVVLGQGATRQPDTRFLRTWEVAGTTHGDWKLILEHGPLRIRDIGSPPDDYPGTPPSGCARPPFSHIPFYMAQNRAYDWLAEWAAHGKQPPSAPYIELTSVNPLVAARDEHGNALGGLRLPQFQVPVAEDSALNSGPGFCFLHGAHIPFSDAVLRELYPTRGAYVRRIVAATRRSLSAGYIGAADARAMIREAVRNGPYG